MFDYEYWGYKAFPGATNMALEEYMLKKAAKTKKAMIRFYSFPKDTIVLGYAQATDVLKNVNDVNIVRRATGGSHVQTGKNVLAYSFVAPRDSFRNFEDMRSYYSEYIKNAFLKLGIENVEVDNRASSVNVNNKVAAAHAMIWGVESGLLHGLIILEPYDMEKLAKRITLNTRVIGGKVYSDYDAIKNIPTMINILPNLTKNTQDKTEAIREILQQTILNEITKGKHKSMNVTDEIIKKSYPLLEKRYGKQIWTKEHDPVFTKDEIDIIPGEKLNGKLKKNLGYCMFLQVDDTKFKKMASKE